MNVQEYPNTEEYLARFLLTLRKQALVSDEETFEASVRENGLLEAEVELLQ